MASGGHHRRFAGWNMGGAGSSAAVPGSPDLAGLLPDEAPAASAGAVAAQLAQGLL
ncbi:MAG: hypothetical protein GY772_06505, partial [bacterium]|nr:hypothetical protein [bacterium]